MPKVSPIQSDFSGGEFAPSSQGRVNLDRYATALDTCENYIPILQGALTRRPGTMYVAEVKTSSKATRLIRFEFSITQAYMLEFGDQYIRFYRDYGQITTTGSTPYEISSPYLEADLFQLKFTQSADVLYIVHPDYAPRSLSRTGHTSWTLSTISFTDGPYLPINATTTTLDPSATSGTGVTVVASAVTGINGGQGFLSSDVGRKIRLREQSGDQWGWATITGYTSTTQVTVTINAALGDANATAFWRLGVWSDTTGYPSCTTFHEDRLVFGGVPDFPQRVDMSELSIYESFKPSALDDGAVVDTDAVSFTLNANDVNAVRWFISDEKGLIAGSVGGEWIIRPSSQSEAITPSNVTAKRSTTYGSADIQALQVGKSGIFVQRSGRKLREITYFFDVDGFRAVDLTVLADHVTESGIVEFAQQKEPHPLVWAVREDGQLACMTYERDIDSFKAGWHRHIIGGESDAAGSAAVVESIAVIPSPDGVRDDLWMIVRRRIDGATKRYVEYMTPFFDDTVEQKDAFFVDSGLTYDDPKTITGATKADPCVLTVATHGFSNGDKVLISGVLGMSELNTNSYYVANQMTNSFELVDEDGNNIDSTGFTTYVSGGEVRKYVSTISGLNHLEGQTVDVLADGAVRPSEVVSSGAITLDRPGTTIQIGLGYESKGKMLRLNAGAADGTAMGKTKRIHYTAFMMHRSLGLKIGFSFDELDTLTFRTAADAMTRAPELFTGIRGEHVEANYDTENQICFVQDQPLPSMILAIMPHLVTQDRT